MKNVLFASTALVAFAGVASADITLSGSAEMGLFDNDAPGTDLQFHTDVDVTFTMTGETDGGLAFGTSVDIDEVTADRGSLSNVNVTPVDQNRNTLVDFADTFSLDDATVNFVDDATGNDAEDGGVSIFLSGAFGTLTMGDTDGGFDWGLTEVAFNSGSIADDETEHAGYSGNSGLDGLYDGQILRYDFSAGAFGVAASIELDDSAADNDAIYGLGLRYDLTLGATTVGLGFGYQTVDMGPGMEREIYGISANTTLMDNFTVGVNYSELDSTTAGVSTDTEHLGLGVGYNSGPISLSANYGEFDSAGVDVDGFGLSAGFDLGGGASVVAGYGYSDDGAGGSRAGDEDRYSLGFQFSF
ncbi:porin [Jannaschia sp. W003]|uniref:porin n=1 Tax=Jannaschia sp. W003 TaxID=2867012 RepID=UPI0021A2B0A0|nr:porin [Jannaschia sp. W003]UWQ22127.1 porin [Jannaschia sp. W003]